MKHVIYIFLIILSIVSTYKITFAMSQEVMGALYIQKHVTDHKIHTRLVKAVKSNDQDKIKSIATGMQAGDVEIIQSLISALEGGNFTHLTNEKIEKGKSYLDSVKTIND